MVNNNRVILGLLAVVLVFGNVMQGQAEDHNTNKTAQKTTGQKAKSQAPIVIEANELSFSDETGDILAKGNVVITDDGQRMEAELVNGNEKLSEVWVKDKAIFSLPGTMLTGTNTIYNYKLNTGSMDFAKGKADGQYVEGRDISIYPNQIEIYKGTTTGCPAKNPDYHISADRIEIWPGDKLIAYNAKFWIKNTVIFALPKYKKSLKKDEAESEFPRIGYDSDDGFSIRQNVNYPLTEKLSAYYNLDYYTKAGFRPSYGLLDSEKNYSIGVTQGQFRDSDGNWIKKSPEFKFYYYPHRFGSKSPLSYTFTAIYGKWTDKTKTSWHQDYSLYFSRDAIKINKTTNLYLGTGIGQVRESYNRSLANTFRFDATVTKTWSKRFNAWVGYHYVRNNSDLFDYDSTAVSRELASGFVYKIDKMNSIGVSQSYDLNAHKVYDMDYTWYRNLHCWTATITYRAERHQLRFDLSTTRW